MTLNNPTTESAEIVSYFTMRKTIGWLGMALPILLLGGNLLMNNIDLFNSATFVKIKPEYADYSYINQGSWKGSVSHYYYTTMGEIFTGTLYAVGLFMLCYTGHKKRDTDFGFSDNTMTNAAGIFAIGVATFPTTSDVGMTDNLRRFISSDVIGTVHYTFALLFFVTLALMSIINFRRTDTKGFGKGRDSNAYLTYGIVMLICLALVPILANIDSLKPYRPTFLLEAIALIAFGTSWLRKGRADFTYLPKKLGFRFSPATQTQ